MNLVIPIASNSKFFSIEEYGYPKPLIEIMGKPMIQHVVENLTHDTLFEKIIFIVRQDECDKYHLDNTLTLLSPIKPQLIKLRADTEGALCSVLLAVEHMNDAELLVIANADQIFDGGISEWLKKFTSSNLDAACLTFSSVHPRWSYVRVDHQSRVVETAEKRPISKHAVAGLYMYKKGSDFVRYGMDSIKHGSSVDGKYFISPVFNEFVLANKKVGHFEISNERYHTFYSPQKIEEFESQCGRGV
ncbi:glycosyltransferase family 2 protein [Polynucleobacter paludilacus]|uniref:glycosyltransferase family 2 protein n=1 Tax=Polynucleobacter paludilacus TaxID=1855895 RepID=UPI001BFD2844|nr:glycosyltransferase family 2 protein [Polynucleobacter paludilacus]QWD87326.1 glycosyltransferase family 2 protein [Polynucleobacter paludilacus]